VGAFGDDAPTRPGLVRLALERSPSRVDPADAIVIGDTPRDVECARANGCACLAVATGGHSREQLQEAGAERVVTDLGDPAPLLELL
jgi:phosphoglycolate phosphatase-like HAD superfamily hydrolase